MKVLVQYPANTEVNDVALVWDKAQNLFFERVTSYDSSTEIVEFFPVDYYHAQAEVIANYRNTFTWMKQNAVEAGLIVTNQITTYSSYEYKGEGLGYHMPNL